MTYKVMCELVIAVHRGRSRLEERDSSGGVIGVDGDRSGLCDDKMSVGSLGESGASSSAVLYS